MVLEYLLFNGGKSGAFIYFSAGRGIGLKFQDLFYEAGDLIMRSPEEAAADSRRQGFTAYETVVNLTDKNRFSTTIQYNSGRLVGCNTRTTQLTAINPKRAVQFWLELSKALRENPETPDKIRQNLERIKHITLEDCLRFVRQDKTMPADLNQGYLSRVCGLQIAKEYA